MRIPTLVTQGQLDYYLVLPRNVLLHMLVSHMRAVDLGDVLFGPLLLLLMVKLTAVKLLVFAAATLLGAVVILGFFVLAGSLSFFAGNADTAVDQILDAMLHFSTYPTAIFDRGVRLILFTVIPAGFVSTLPVELVRQFDWLRFLELAGAAAVFLGLGIWSFHAGLRRYESGNLMAMRS